MNDLIMTLKRIEGLFKLSLIYGKNILSLKEACSYLDLSESALYKFVSSGEIPSFKPNNKKIYFRKTDLDEWALKKQNVTFQDIKKSAEDFKI